MLDILTRPLLVWFLFMPIAILNGIIREGTYKHYVGDLVAHQISTVFALLAFITLSYFMFREKFINYDTKTLLLVGIFWVILTVGFEFGFGHYVDKAPWEKLFADYNILKGRVWGLFLLIILLTPILIRYITRVK
jgi:hypothetical protein